MAVRSDEIASIIKNEIATFGTQIQQTDVGSVIEAGDGVVRIHGLSGALYGELIEFPRPSGEPIVGMALNLEEDSVSAVILGEYGDIKEGDEARSTRRVAQVPVGEALLGRVVNGLGEPIDGRGPINTTKFRPVERIAPNVVTRSSVNTPVQTGIKAIDAMIPIGRGQRELIIGDRQTGKSAIALDTIINQKGGDLICIYVAIGQKQSTIAGLVGSLERYGAMEHSVVVAAAAADPAPMWYLAPYTGCAIGEYFMYKGREALVAYD